jgi:hypothetical protein
MCKLTINIASTISRLAGKKDHFSRRDVYVIGFIKYQLPKWEKALNIQRKINSLENTFDPFLNMSGSDKHRKSIKLDTKLKVPINLSKDSEYSSPDTKQKLQKLIKIRDDIETNEYIEKSLKKLKMMAEKDVKKSPKLPPIHEGESDDEGSVSFKEKMRETKEEDY